MFPSSSFFSFLTLPCLSLLFLFLWFLHSLIFFLSFLPSFNSLFLLMILKVLHNCLKQSYDIQTLIYWLHSYPFLCIHNISFLICILFLKIHQLFNIIQYNPSRSWWWSIRPEMLYHWLSFTSNSSLHITLFYNFSLYKMHTISFQTFFVRALLLIVHTWNSSPLQSNLL